MSSIVAKHGIVSILGSDRNQIIVDASLKRTISADMSSKKWLSQNGFSFSPMRRIASSKELTEKKDDSSSCSYKEDEEPGHVDVWRLIQFQKKEVEKPGQVDIWGSIVSQKANEEEKSTLPPPYVHPLVKRSTSSLSEKSLEICTESLGSETGSDKFSSYAPSETGDAKEDGIKTQVSQPQPQQEKDQIFDLAEPRLENFNFSTTKKSPHKSFPPPLPSLSERDGPALHMQPRREDGRLVLEAVSIHSQNCFCAHRKDGRLLLTIAHSSLTQQLHFEKAVNQEEDVDEVEEQVLNYFQKGEDDYIAEEEEETDEEGEEDDNEEEVIKKFEIENGAKELRIVMDQARDYSSGVIYVHRSALLMKNLIGFSNRNPKWTEKLKETVNFVKIEMKMEETNKTQSQSLPRPPRMARLIPSPPIAASAASFNAYDYFWQTKPAMASAISPITKQKSTINNYTKNVISPNINQIQEMELLRGNKRDYLVSLVRSCKENKKSLLFWEPYCIATS